MFGSIWDDIVQSFRSGNMITRLVVINVAVFVIVILLNVFTAKWPVEGGGTLYQLIVDQNMALSSDWRQVLSHPWTVVTHMFLHKGLGHILFNMLVLYWFGRISGDLLGDQHILPIYASGAIFGAVVFLIAAHFSSSIGAGIAFGASAGVMSIVLAAGFTAPDYEMNLILFGRVRIKFIILAILIIDLAMNRQGGSVVAHLGGAFFGAMYVNGLRSGYHLGSPIMALQKLFSKKERTTSRKAPMRVAHKSNLIGSRDDDRNQPISEDHQSRLDSILEKIKAKGFEQLSEEEKEFLYQASKK